MTIPREVESFCNSILLGMKYAGAAPDDWIAYALKKTDQQQLAIVVRFLDEMWAGNYDATALQQIWDQAASRFGLAVDGDLQAFLSAVRDRIGPPA